MRKILVMKLLWQSEHGSQHVLRRFERNRDCHIQRNRISIVPNVMRIITVQLVFVRITCPLSSLQEPNLHNRYRGNQDEVDHGVRGLIGKLPPSKPPV